MVNFYVACCCCYTSYGSCARATLRNVFSGVASRRSSAGLVGPRPHHRVSIAGIRYVIVTITTVGYGDLFPITWYG